MKSKLLPIYASSFFYTLFVALTTYINSSFLTETQGVSTQTLGIFYTCSAILSAVLVLIVPRITHRISQRILGVGLMLATAIFVAGMSDSLPQILTIVCFIVFSGLTSAVYLVFDTSVEHYSKDADTGKTRGTYYSLLNIAWVIAPLITGALIASSHGYRGVYIIGIMLIIIACVIGVRAFKNISLPTIQLPSLVQSLRSFVTAQPLRLIGVSSLLLQIFYAIMVVYAPLYLHEHLGIAWKYIGIMFTIMLIPFPIIQPILGRLADKRWGEKEMLGIGYAIMITSTIIFAVIKTPHWWIWAIVLCITRIGAAIVEIMNEAYFFKQINDTNTDSLGIYRLAYPVAYIIAPLAFSAFFIFGNNVYHVMFLILAVLMVGGIGIVLHLQDTK
jgi:MFS family permease